MNTTDIFNSMMLEGIDEQWIVPICQYCDGEGRIETDNNGPIVDCPLCSPEPEWEYIKEMDCWHNTQTNECLSYCPKVAA